MNAHRYYYANKDISEGASPLRAEANYRAMYMKNNSGLEEVIFSIINVATQPAKFIAERKGH